LRVYLNASILRNLTGSNLNTIKDFLSVYRTPDDFLHSPDEHNQHYGLTDKDNRKGRDEFGNKIKISELIKQACSHRKATSCSTGKHRANLLMAQHKKSLLNESTN
jgi:hypothetical protein